MINFLKFFGSLLNLWPPSVAKSPKQVNETDWHKLCKDSYRIQLDGKKTFDKLIKTNN